MAPAFDRVESAKVHWLANMVERSGRGMGISLVILVGACVEDTVEAAFAGLLEVKYNKKSKLEEVVLPHRSAKDFLLDTVEGQNLWQPCDIPREELCARHFKSLLADGRLYSEDPDYSLTQGVDIRNLLSDMFRWHGEQGFHLEMINTFFELARVCRLRRHVHPILQKYPDLQLRRIKGQYPLHVAAGGDIQHFHYLLQKYEISKEESIYCQFFNLCNFSSFKSTEIRLIERILVNGYSPNWNAVNTPTTTGNRLIASPWFNFLITLLDKPCIFFPGTSRSDLRPLFSDVIQMFLKAGASLESRFPVVIRVELFGNDSITIGWANQLTSSPTSFLPQYVLFEMNGKAAVDFVKGHYYDPEPKNVLNGYMRL
ncbi:hypothetical protein BKA60DRAFT_547666 [Fusarium oxysporum]|nr:hypothetical protein BKA60DRAFT_547666 [Fusarium oxysporum]